MVEVAIYLKLCIKSICGTQKSTSISWWVALNLSASKIVERYHRVALRVIF